MNISILASIGCQNLGDELILKNEVLLLEKQSSDLTPLLTGEGNIKFKVFSYDPKNPFFEKENIEYLEYFPVGIKNPKNIVRNLYNFFIFIKTVIWSDLIVIGGGGIIYDRENQSVRNPLNQWVFRISISRFFRKNIIFYGVGIDIKNSLNLSKVKKIFSGAKEIFVRDKNSQNILNNLGIKSKIIQDPVFYDNNHKNTVGADLVSAQKIPAQKIPAQKITAQKITAQKIPAQKIPAQKIPAQKIPAQKITAQKITNCIKKIECKKFNLKDLYNIDFKNKNIGIAFRSGFFNNIKNHKPGEEMEVLKIKEIINYIIKSGGKIILLPHSFHKTDILANDYKFLNIFKSGLLPSMDLKISSSMQETYNYYKEKKLDICLAQRLHSMILSEVYDIPFVGIIYGEKTRELLK